MRAVIAPQPARPRRTPSRTLAEGTRCTVAEQTITQLLRAALQLPQGRPAYFLSLHTFGEYLDFHPHVHALVADGLLDSDGQ